MMFRRCVMALTCLLFGGAIATASGWAGAQGAPTAQPEEAKATTDAAPALVLLFEPERPDSTRLIRAIESHLVGLPVRVVLEPLSRGEILTWLESGHTRARARQALGLVAIDTGQRDLWRLFFLDVEGAPTLIWRLRPSPDQAPLDEAGVAVRLLVEALLDAKPPSLVAPLVRGSTHGRSDGGESHRPAESPAQRPSKKSQDRPKPATAQPTESKPKDESESEGESESKSESERPSQKREQRLALFLGPTATTWVVDRGWQFGATAGVGLHPARAWSVNLAYIWYPTLEYQLADTGLSLSRHPVASYVAFVPVSGFSPRFWLGMWVDPVLRVTPETAGSLRGTAAETTWSWGPIGGVGVISAPLAALDVRFDLGLEVEASGVEYVTEGQTRAVVASTRRVRPFLSLCMGLRL